MRRLSRNHNLLFPMSKSYLAVCLAALLLCVAFAPPAAADVDVNVEGAYTESNLVLYIYADITSAILSCGVKITYDTSELTLFSAEKNEDVWFFGDGTTNHPYMEPETATPGEVIIIGGKLDTAAPTAGVIGNWVLLGKVVFTRTGSTMPFTPTLSVDYARGGDFDNFVQTDGVVLDGAGVSFSINIVCKIPGDANFDGIVNISDLGLVQSNWLLSGSNILDPRADINGDGIVNIADLGLVQANWLSNCP